MRNAILLSAVILLSTACLAGAQEKKLGVTFDLTYMSKYMSKGVESYGRQGALFKTIDFDFYGTGFGAKIIHRNATSSGYVNSQRLDYRPYFKSILFDGTPHATKYNISVGYEHYTGHPRNLANTTWEWIFAFSWPNLLPGKLVPSYIAHYEYPAASNQAFRGVTGWVPDLFWVTISIGPKFLHRCTCHRRLHTTTASVGGCTTGRTPHSVFQQRLTSIRIWPSFRAFTTSFRWMTQFARET